MFLGKLVKLTGYSQKGGLRGTWVPGNVSCQQGGRVKQGRSGKRGLSRLQVQDSLCSMSGMISGGHNPLGTPGTSPSQNDLASLIQA